jgi:hypothetical protein
MLASPNLGEMQMVALVIVEEKSGSHLSTCVKIIVMGHKLCAMEEEKV